MLSSIAKLTLVIKYEAQSLTLFFDIIILESQSCTFVQISADVLPQTEKEECNQEENKVQEDQCHNDCNCDCEGWHAN